MKSVLNGPGAHLFGMLAMSFSAGALAIIAFGKALRNDTEWMILAVVTVVFLVVVGINAIRHMRKIRAS
jgi:large-conductance mechanosensitive channel